MMAVRLRPFLLFLLLTPLLLLIHYQLFLYYVNRPLRAVQNAPQDTHGITILTLYHSDTHLHKQSQKSHEQYANAHGYQYVHRHQQVVDTKGIPQNPEWGNAGRGSYNKVAILIKELLEKLMEGKKGWIL
jgi:hypothetical protein